MQKIFKNKLSVEIDPINQLNSLYCDCVDST